MTLADQQAFEIWYNTNPKLTFEDARRACGIVGTHRELAAKIFFSEGWEFQRWLFTSGFQEFVDTQCDEPETGHDGEVYGTAPREKVLGTLKCLWHWMKENEKQFNG
jgi:hypothetical protein